MATQGKIKIGYKIMSEQMWGTPQYKVGVFLFGTQNHSVSSVCHKVVLISSMLSDTSLREILNFFKTEAPQKKIIFQVTNW